MFATGSKSMPPTPITPTAPKSKKSRKKRRGGNTTEDSGGQQHHGVQRQNREEEDNDEEQERGSATDKIAKPQMESIQMPDQFASITNDNDVADLEKIAMTKGPPNGSSGYVDAMDGDTQSRLDALLQEREALREQVIELRLSLESIQAKHAEELEGVTEQVESERKEKEDAQELYESLVGRVNTLRAQLGERLKADAEELARTRSELAELEAKNKSFHEQNDVRIAELAQLAMERDEQSKELSTLRNRVTLSQQNWNEERDDLIQREAFARKEFENAKQAMQDWEVLAMEERNIRQGLEDKVLELEEQLQAQGEAHERVKQERDTQGNAVEGLQRGLQEIQDARKQELRELVERTDGQISELRKQVEAAQASERESSSKFGSVQQELKRLMPIEAEIKEKNILIGKLRHEAVILNDHLTKALRQLKRGKTEDTIDRQLVTNHLIQFLSLNQGDPKKFQILQIMAAMLNFTDEQREVVGLSRPGASNPNLRTPISPWHRIPSTPTLNAANLGAHSSDSVGRKDSVAGLFSEFLESEAEGTSSKATSVSGSSRPVS